MLTPLRNNNFAEMYFIVLFYLNLPFRILITLKGAYGFERGIGEEGRGYI